MKKLLVLIYLGLPLFLLTGCGPSEEEQALTKVVYDKYKNDAKRTDTYVPFNILNMEIENETMSGDTVFYDIEFVIQEMHPSRRYYYEGDGKAYRVNGKYYLKKYYYTEHRKLNR